MGMLVSGIRGGVVIVECETKIHANVSRMNILAGRQQIKIKGKDDSIASVGRS